MDWQNAIRAGKLREGKSKMVTVGSKILMIVNLEGVFHATEGLCKHMKWVSRSSKSILPRPYLRFP